MQNKPPVIFKNHIDIQVFDSHFLAVLLDNIKKIKRKTPNRPIDLFGSKEKQIFLSPEAV